MSAVSTSSSGTLKRSLADLLASRPKKQDRKAESSSRKIQEAAVYLLSCHQDVSQFLLEVKEPSCKRVCDGEGSEFYLSSRCTLFPEPFIGSTLRDQALHLGVAVDVLGAKAAVSALQHAGRGAGSGTGNVLLLQEQRDQLIALLKTLKGLQLESSFRRSVFLQEIWKQERPPVLEVVWHLQSMDIVGLEDLLESCKDASSAVDWFCSEMRSLCLHMEDSPVDLEFVERIISNLLAVLIGRAFGQSDSSVKHSEQSKMTKVSLSILNTMLSWLLDAVLKAGNGQTYKPGAERHWLIAYTASRYRAHVIPESLEDFFLHTLSQTLTYKPELKVSDAIRFQGTWSFVKTCPLLTDLYRKLFVLLDAEKLTSHIRRVLDTQEVNWHHVLSFFSCLVICQSEAQYLVKDLLTRLLSQAFENYELEYLITAFLISRQVAQEGPAAFISYTEWFKGAFGAASSYQSTSKKSLVFLLKFLSDLVPFETPQYLKVHILHPPFVPTKFRPLLMEYISLAKTRLVDMKVSIEDMGLYEDLSAGPDKDQARSQAQQDVEKAVQIFENTGKIPASVMEASIFRRPYFSTRFLPALLSPRVLPEEPDSHMLLIESLKRAVKIPANLISAYLDACELAKHRMLEGNAMDVSLNEEPMAKLQSALWELRPLVTDSKRYDEVSSQVAVVSDRLTSVMGPDNLTTVPVISQPLFSLTVEELEPQELSVSDLLLTSFCQCVMAASRTNPPNRQGSWPTLYVKMLCGHRRVLFSVLTRTLQLLCHKAPLLKDAHIVGLATFSVHLHECWTSLAPLGSEVTSLQKFWEALLSPQCSNSHSVLLRFCTAAVSYACCRFSFPSSGTSSNLIPPLLIRKLHHLLPRLVPETRKEGRVQEDVDASLVFRGQSLPSAGWKEAALSLWHQACFKDLLKDKRFQLSFRDWLLWEMSLDPSKDPLSDTERQDYRRWAISQQFLPESSAAGGCGNDLEKACLIIVDAVLDFNLSSMVGAGSPPSIRTGLPDMLCHLQELVCDLMIGRSGKISHVDFLFNAFHQRIAKLSDSMETGAQLQRQSELAMSCRILLSLPSSLLVSPEMGSAALKSEDFFQFVNKHLKNISERGYALPYNITAHFFKGLLGSSRHCEGAEETVSSVLTATYSRCPIMLLSAALWWPQLDSAIMLQWNRQFGGDLPKKIGVLKEIQVDVDRCLSQRSVLSIVDPTWLSAAFLYFSIRRNKIQRKTLTDILSNLNRESVQLLDCLLFFSIIDLIPVTLKEEAAHKGVLENALQMVQCLEERGGSWLRTFQLSADKRPLHQAVSEEFLKLLPMAFFSLATCLPVESVVRQQNFLSISLDMYSKLFQLFLDGSPILHPQQADPQTLFSRGRRFLLSCILKCPKPSAVVKNQLSQIVDCWDEKDPELSGLLKNLLQPSQDNYLYDEPDLF